MRILEIRFKNLNSLAGEWRIDLGHPDYVSHGIFAITGPTGAGKTTILDALCLALYGRTPRLGKITKGGNEIMARRTGECFAEAIFETPSGRFRCHWSQHRARKRPDGELQPPRHEIADCDSGRVIETKIRRVAELVERETGMDFDRFTRSALLAQGGFAAFLQAGEDERAPILEQLTGTGVYSRISMAVHERRAEEKAALQRRREALASLDLMEPEEERSLRAELAALEEQGRKLAEEIERLRKEEEWLSTLARLEREGTELAGRRQELQRRLQAFAPEQKRLAGAIRALEVAPMHQALQTARKDLTAVRREIEEAATRLPRIIEEKQRALRAEKTAAQRLRHTAAAARKSAGRIREARSLDARIASAARILENEEETLARLLREHEVKQRRRRQEEQDMTARKERLAEIQRRRRDSRADEALVAGLDAIKERFAAATRLGRDRTRAVQGLSAARGERDRLAKAYENALRERETAQEALTRREKDLEAARDALRACLGERDMGALRGQWAALRRRAETLGSAASAARMVERARARQAALAREAAIIAKQTAAAEKEEAALAQRMAALEREEQDVSRQVELLGRIERLADARRDLAAGTPCPLCGSLEHPYAEQAPAARAEMDEARQRLHRLRREHQEAIARHARQAAELEKLRRQRLQNDQEADLAEKELSEAAGELATLCRDLEICHDKQEARLLEALQKQADDRAEEVNARLGQAESLVRRREEVAALAVQARDRLAQAERRAGEAALDLRNSRERLATLGREHQAVKKRLEAAIQGLRAELAAYGIGLPGLDSLENVLGQLEERRARWLEIEEEEKLLSGAIAVAGESIAALDSRLSEIAAESARQKDRCRACDNELRGLREQRRQLFGDKDPDAEEQKLTDETEAAARDLDKARADAAACAETAARLESAIAQAKNIEQERAAALARAELDFSRAAAAKGFTGEDDFTAAWLHESERSALRERGETLAREEAELAARERENKKRLEEERKKGLTSDDAATVRARLTERAGEHSAILRQTGAAGRRLADNELRRKRQTELVAALEKQRRECARWDSLHELIGSADGKKFRNFAQGLTFERMVGHANRQLALMTDRYLLVRDRQRPLDLNVMDIYQGGEIRSTKNLSGGESFIVSLALALGLAAMSGRNVRVDSLFLDEGFGTLDDDALDTALDALAGLRRDEGKLIGVISHVAGLKERIPTRIRVVPGPDGRAAIQGPGVTAGT